MGITLAAMCCAWRLVEVVRVALSTAEGWSRRSLLNVRVKDLVAFVQNTM